MKLVVAVLISATLFLIGCGHEKPKNDLSVSGVTGRLNNDEFKQLLSKVAHGWNTGDAKAAADCFSSDAVYIEPPDQQLYRGRDELYEFFGGDEGRASPMKMTWHHLIFDEAKQVGTGEYTFAYKGRLSHGIVIVQVSGGRIRHWREYQYRSKITWEDFIGESAF